MITSEHFEEKMNSLEPGSLLRTIRSPQLLQQFRDYVDQMQEKLEQKQRAYDEQCYKKYSDNAQKYAQCYFDQEEKMGDEFMKNNYRIRFVEKQLYECTKRPEFNLNSQQEIDFCLKQSKESFDYLLKNMK